MAIKKGAFEIYTQERKLPEKGKRHQLKKNHFFDNSYEETKGSQSVHDGFKDNEDNNCHLSKGNCNILDNSVSSDVYNGSQSVHDEPLNNEQNEISPYLQRTSENEIKVSFSRLVGNQREIVIALYKNMRLNKSDTTEELTLEMIANLAGVNQKSLKNTLFRLTSAGFLSRAEQKSGRGGWVKYKINEKIIHEIQQKDFFITLKTKKLIS